LNIKVENSSEIDRINAEKGKAKMLDKEIAELENQKKVLLKSHRHQQNTMTKLYDDPEFRFKLEKTTKGIAQKKEENAKMQLERRQLRKEQDKVIKEMSDLNKVKFQLIEERNKIKNGKKTTKMRRAKKAIDEINIIKSRVKVIENLRDKKESKTKQSCLRKEKLLKEYEQMIKVTKKQLKNVTTENEQLSQNVKDLKNMVPKTPLISKNADLDNSRLGSRQAHSPPNDLGIDPTINKLKEQNILRDNIEDMNSSFETNHKGISQEISQEISPERFSQNDDESNQDDSEGSVS